MKRMVDIRGVVIALVILIFCTANAIGKEGEFPVMPINIYIGWAPGGAASQTAIIVAEGMKKYLKQPVFVNYKPGAAQGIAAEFVKNSKPDGYTLFYVSTQSLIVKVVTDGPKLSFRLEDFDSLGAGTYASYFFAVNGNSPLKTVEDLIAAARKSPGKLNIAHTGYAGLPHFTTELFSMQNRIILNQIPYGGGAPVITALLGGHVDIGIGSTTAFGDHIMPGGGLRALVVFDQKRDASFPHVPTAVEKGMDITSIDNMALSAPKDLPNSVRDTLVQALKKAIEDPEISSRLNKLLGIQVAYYSPEEMDKIIQKDCTKFKGVWEKIKTVPEKK